MLNVFPRQQAGCLHRDALRRRAGVSMVGTLQSPAWQQLVKACVPTSWAPDTSQHTLATVCSGCFWSSSIQATSPKLCSMVVLLSPLPPLEKAVRLCPHTCCRTSHGPERWRVA